MTVSSAKSARWNHISLWKHKRTYILIIHIYFPIWMKYDSENQHILLFNICEFHELGAKKAAALLWTLMQLRLQVCAYRETVRNSESKERLSEGCLLCHGVHHSQSFCICCRFITGLLFLYLFSSSGDQNLDPFSVTISFPSFPRST